MSHKEHIQPICVEYDQGANEKATLGNQWKRPWNKLGPFTVHLETPPNWHPETLFVSEPVINALLARSNKSQAKKLMRFVYEEETYATKQSTISTFTRGTTVINLYAHKRDLSQALKRVPPGYELVVQQKTF
ncbi:unnamed protein product [Arctia plantaginis]|uniref:Bro-N domain-containing protein n=1 Tax=Arctia plantaginis TaxID=874455 RepID=A0A8S0YS81_ARCPL|nr:unnamed protein product [Arctia plantaginis]CAB3232312.1 unnamed protein product [Arctia plantaginis]